MSGSVVTEAHRPRPLSGALWTLFSWLRRDERSSSEESISSAGSDRTAASFAFLTPALYPPATAPARLPHALPPTDSYKKRLRDRNLRRQHERDITLHRKYGLYGFGYDAQTLPHARRGAADGRPRERRAASESPREHVPGKRRAPLPPTAAATLGTRRSRKRPAPPPPLQPTQPTERNDHQEPLRIEYEVPMSRLPLRDDRPSENRESITNDPNGCKSEKYSKKDARAKETKDVKLRHEKSFLKQIFDNRKRNSAIDTSSVKLLPSISELDKQAVEIIEKYRLKEMVRNDATDRQSGPNEAAGSSKLQVEAWICTRCLRKYDATVIICNFCLPLNKANDAYKSSKLSNHGTQTNSVPGSSRSKPEDKEKLKEMLKEMKDSLPKRPKSDNIIPNKPKNSNTNEDYPKIVEAPTLRIGSSISVEESHSVARKSLDKDSSIQITSQEIKKDQIGKKNDLKSVSGNSPLESAPSKLPSNDSNKELKETNRIITNASGNDSGQVSYLSKSVPIENKKDITSINTVLVTQPVVLVHTKESNVVSNKPTENKYPVKIAPLRTDTGTIAKDNINEKIHQTENLNKNSDPKSSNLSKANHDLNTPLKISSLLNPIYIPKSTVTVNTQTSTQQSNINVRISKSVDPVPLTQVKISSTQNIKPSEHFTARTPSTSSNLPIREITPTLKIKLENTETVSNDKVTPVHEIKKPVDKEKIDDNTVIALPSTQDNPANSNEIRLNQHSRRRDLIHQLEMSIAKGDEKAAADAAVQLAQLRLSCSVLSFSSQIIAEASTSSAPQQSNLSNQVNEKKNKIEGNIQKSAQTTEKVVEKQLTEPNIPTNYNNEVRNNITDVTKIETENNLLKKSLNSKSNKDIKAKNNCEASTSKGVTTKESDNENIPILVWVEDKEATRGPVQLHVRRDAVMGELRKQAEQSLGLAAGMQRWIVGRALCTDDNTLLLALAGPELTAPFYLCLVESAKLPSSGNPDSSDINDIKLESKENSKPDLKINGDAGNVYNELMKLEHQAIVSNTEEFECGVCIENCEPGRGVVLRECVHSFCRECLSDMVRHSEEPVVTCPAMGCPGMLQEREVRGVVPPEEYEKWLARGLAAAESGTRNAFHCRTRDCTGWALCEPGVRRFPCPVCRRTNCVPCQAIHEKETCEQYRTKLQESANTSSADASNSNTDEGTRAFLDTLISRGEALECPECSAIITKKWGCDWVKCSACKTEICWVTKGRRWGPAGRGDTSAGCRCGVDGKRCHPSCGYCH